MGMVQERAVRTAIPALLLLLSAAAEAAGLEIIDRGVRETAIAYGGSAALVEDAGAVFSNPAGLVRLEGRSASVGLSLFRNEQRYDVSVHRTRVPEVGGVVPGSGQGRAAGLWVAPRAYYAHRLSERTAVGLGVYPAFGVRGSYPADWAGRYHSTESSLTAVNLQPVFAWRVTDRVSVGGGPVVQYLEAEFRNAVDIGYIAAAELVQMVRDNPLVEPIPADAVAKLAHRFDIDNVMTVDSISLGVGAGLLWQVSERTRLGLNYQSGIRHVATGRAVRPQTEDPVYRQQLEQAIGSVNVRLLGLVPAPISVVDPQAASDGADMAVGPLGAAGGAIQLITRTPDSLTLSGYIDLSPRMALAGGLTFTGWSVLDEFRFSYTDSSERGGADISGSGDDVRRRDLVQTLRWKDTWRYGLGVIVRPHTGWTLRGGVAHDQSPVPDPEARMAQGGDSDRLVLTVGAGWQCSSRLSLDLAYAHTRFRSVRINQTEMPSGSLHRMDGRYDAALHNVGVQIGYAF